MKFGFGAAIVASLSLSLVSVPAASQTVNCTELRLQQKAAEQQLREWEIQLALFGYESKKADLQYWLDAMMYHCEMNNASGMQLECKQEAEEYYYERLAELDNDKSYIESEVSAAAAELSGIDQQMIDANCPWV